MSCSKKIVERPNTKFKLPEITLQETYDIIADMKSSTTCGYDSINSKTIKQSPHITSILMTHAINVIIRKGKIPECMKISRILPLSKPGKK